MYSSPTSDTEMIARVYQYKHGRKHIYCVITHEDGKTSGQIQQQVRTNGEWGVVLRIFWDNIVRVANKTSY